MLFDALSLTALGLMAAVRAAANIVPAHAAGNASWPYHNYTTADFKPPALHINHYTEPSEGYLFFAPDGATEFEMVPLIYDITGQLI